MNEFCVAFLIFCLNVDISYSQRWWYVPVPSYAIKPQANSGYQVAGWSSSHTTEPPLGPNDRMNTTDVPEEIEARPDKTRAQRRQLLKRMNPGFTNAQIEAQLIRDDKARAKMAATQSEPVVILPEPVTAPTKPPPVNPPKPKPKAKAKAQPKPKQKPAKQANSNNVWQATSAGKFGSIVKRPAQRQPGSKQNQQRVNPARNARRRRPKTTTTTTTEPLPTTYPPTYPPTTDYIPTTYPTPAYHYNDPIVNNHPRRGGPPPRRQPPMRRQQAPRRNTRPRPRPRPRPLVGSEIGHILSIVG